MRGEIEGTLSILAALLVLFTAMIDPVLAPERVEQHIEALVELAMVCHWLLNVPGTRRYATEALARAEQVGRSDLAAGAMGALAFADSSDRELEASLQGYQRAFMRAGGRAELCAWPCEVSGRRTRDTWAGTGRARPYAWGER